MRAALVLALAVASCGTGDAKPTAASALCKTLLPPKAVLAPLPPVPYTPPLRSSRMVAQVELKLASIVKELEAKSRPRLAEERGQPIGAAGHLNYTVDRGPFTATVENEALVVRTDIRAHAEACRGTKCYASCAPEGKATAIVSLRLGADYRFAPSRVQFAFTRGCEVRALGGFLRIDLTPTIEAQVQSSLRRVEHQIDASLPPMKPRVDRLWAELAKARPLPLGGCATVNALGLVLGPIAGTPEALKVRIAVIAYPEIGTQPCAQQPPPSRPLPPLVQDPAMPAEDEVVVALLAPLQNAANAIQKGEVTRAFAEQSGAQALVDVSVHGEACGEVAAFANVIWADDKRSLRFDAPDVLAKHTFAAAIDPTALPGVVPALAASMSDPSVNVSATITDVKPLAAGVRSGDVLATLVVRGSLGLSEK